MSAPKQPSVPRGSSPWRVLLTERWPTLAAIVLALLTALGGTMDAEFTSFVSALIVFMAFIYLATAVLGRRSAAWLVFLSGFVVVTVLKVLALNVVSVFGFLLAALAFLLWGVRRQGWRNGLPLETIGMALFGALALVVLNLGVTWAGYLAAFGLFAHAAWDTVHLWRNRVVARSYAEFCAVVDALLGVAILIML